MENFQPPCAASADDIVDSAETAALPSCLNFEAVQLARRVDGWTPERQRAFIEQLADCGVVREAAGRVGMTEQGAYALRRRPDAGAFNSAWDTAVQMGLERLHSIAVERAIGGTVRRRYFRGELVGEDRIFDNRLLIYLLGRARPSGRSSLADVRRDEWPGWADAVEDGADRPLPGPDAHRTSPVWRGEDRWLTSFPAPEGFAGEQWFGEEEDDYCRELDPSEQAAVEAWEQRSEAQEQRRRDLYFRRLAAPLAPGTPEV